ncbi:MAG: hypothetical protein ABW190_11110 [Rhizobacter sp.]
MTMATVGGWMKTNNDVMRDLGRELRRPVSAQGEWSGSIGWTDSSWDLAQGLDVVEDLPLDAWPAEMPAALTQ